MKTLGIGLCVFSAALFAQWPSHQTAGTLRNPDGRPILTAPAPKTPDGHPDLSGIWDRGMPAVAPSAVVTPPLLGPGPFQNLPSMFPVGLPFQPWAAELRKQRLEENGKDYPDAHCLPLHPVQLHFHPQPRKITDGRPLPSDDPQTWWFSKFDWQEDGRRAGGGYHGFSRPDVAR